MKLIELRCKNCGALLNINSKTDIITCSYCHTKFKVDDEIQHIQYDNMNDSGYEFEKGRIRAQREEQQKIIKENDLKREEQKKAERKKKNTKWWILGWIFFFPAPLTVLIWKSKFSKKTKALLTILLYLVLLVLTQIK